MSFVDTSNDDWNDYIGPNGVPRINVSADPLNLASDPATQAYQAKLPIKDVPKPTTYIMESDLVETQTGKVHTPSDISFDDAGFAYNNVTGQPVQIIRRPNVLPIARTPDGYTFAMPKILDAASNIVGGVAAPAVATKAGEVVLGSGAVKTAMEAAPAVTGPFYSGLERAVDAAKVNKADASQWLGYLKNQPGVKADEIGQVLKDLPQGPITKEQLQNIVQQNKVQLGEVVKGNNLDPDNISQYAHEYVQDRYPQYPTDHPTYNRLVEDKILELEKEAQSSTKYHDYQLPGGENYQEMLLTLPREKTNQEFINLWKEKTGVDISSYSSAQIARLRGSEHFVSDEIFKSSHWDEPNILAHVRYNDRNIPDVGKSLHLEEIQSDWHQAGRKHGYNNSLTNEERKELNNLYATSEIKLTDLQKVRIKELETKLNAVKIPDAPFKKTWDELAFKRMLHKAATEGYDSVSWTPGEAQAARYDLSKQISKITYNAPGSKAADKYGTVLKAYDHNGHEVINKAAKPEELTDLIGKEAAEKLLKTETKNDKHELAGLDLKVGGEGMKSFYDKMLVDKVNFLGKKYGAKVENRSIAGNDNIKYRPATDTGGGWEVYNKETGEILHRTTGLEGATSYASDYARQPIHVLKFTPELRAKAKEGFPMFSFTPTLNPVTHNPFEQQDQKKKYSLVKVNYDPFK